LEFDRVALWSLTVLVVVAVVLGIYMFPSYSKQSVAGAGNLSANDAMTVRVYFGNSRLDMKGLGDKVFVVEHRIPRTQAVARYAL
jgi:hypothetical protein